MNRSKLMPEPCTDGMFKGYVGLDRINSAALKLEPGERMSNLIHHFNEFNLCEAFRQLDGAKAVGVDQVTKEKYGKNLQANIGNLFDEIYRGGWRTVDHDKLMPLLEKQIMDKKLLRLIRRCLRNSILTEGGLVEKQELGTPQGSPVSPILANIYLHYVLDEWFSENFGEIGEMVRYADDAVFVFNDKTRAEEFRSAMEARLNEFGLQLNSDKSGIRSFDKRSKTGDLPFLGFAFYWGRNWGHKIYLKVKTHPKKLARAIQSFTDWIKANRHRHKLEKLWSMAKAKIIGHYNYYGVTTNLRKLNHFYHACVGQLFKWLNRRSQKRSYTWEGFERRLMFNPIPAPTNGALIVDITNGPGPELKRKPKSRMRENRKYGSVRSNGRQRPLFT